MISVVTITYNNFDELKFTLDSLEGVEGIELIIINGGECQKTSSYLDNFTCNFPLTVVQEKDHGISDAFNKGVANSKGDAITFLNSGDSLLNKSYYRESDDFLAQNPSISFVHSDILYDDPLCGKFPVAPKICLPGRGMPFHHQTMIVRKSAFDDIGFFQLKYKIVMDYDFTLRLLQRGGKGHYFSFSSPPIFMDGNGVSAHQERNSIRESKLSLKENDLFHGKNLFAYYLRLALYQVRTLMSTLGLSGFLRLIKKMKRRKRC